MSDDARPRVHVVYDLDERPPLGEAVPLAVQHLLAMFLGNVTPPLLIAAGLGLAAGETAFVLQMAMLMAGLATVVQAYPVGPVGGRIPIVMGTSIAFVGGIIGIGRESGLVGLLVGYAAFAAAGRVDFSGVAPPGLPALRVDQRRPDGARPELGRPRGPEEADFVGQIPPPFH